MGTVVRLEHYTKSFKKVTVLEDINLTLESGKVIGLKGKNGSGKTMLMRAISVLYFQHQERYLSMTGSLVSRYHFHQVSDFL